MLKSWPDDAVIIDLSLLSYCDKRLLREHFPDRTSNGIIRYE